MRFGIAPSTRSGQASSRRLDLRARVTPRTPLGPVTGCVSVTMPAGKIVHFADGSQWRINYLEFLDLTEGRIFPRRLEIICPAAKVELRFSKVQLDHDFKEKTFSYQQKNFSLKEVDCHNLLTDR